MEDPDLSRPQDFPEVDCDTEPPVLLLRFENVPKGGGQASSTYEVIFGPDATVLHVKTAIAQHEGILEHQYAVHDAPGESFAAIHLIETKPGLDIRDDGRAQRTFCPDSDGSESDDHMVDCPGTCFVGTVRYSIDSRLKLLQSQTDPLQEPQPEPEVPNLTESRAQLTDATDSAPEPEPEPADQHGHCGPHFSVERYGDAVEVWPQSGQHILAQFNDQAILVYQAFSEDIGRYAVEHQGFAGCKQYSCTRMTWIKTNFLWMMYRSKWATRHNQQMVLGVWLKRTFFERLLGSAKSTRPGSAGHPEQAKNTPCRFQWDPDHLPNGDAHVSRRAIQIGVKGELAEQYASEDTSVSPILQIVDVTPFVKEQKRLLDSMARAARAQPARSPLMVARERVYTGLPHALTQCIGVLDYDALHPENV
eukprot:SAG31_NODE_1252_length_9108_cov_24.066711_3_plen_420_part_00